MAERKSINLIKSLPHVILCEGQDEWYFLVQYVGYLVKQHEISDSINVINMGGNEELRKNLPILPKVDHYHEMKGFLVVRDAEKDAVGAGCSLKESFSKAFGICISDNGDFFVSDNGIKYGFVLLPGKGEDGAYHNGTLEDLCCSIIDEDAEIKNRIFEYIDYFLEGTGNLHRVPFKTPHKNKLHAYFSGTNFFVGMKIGEAAKSGCFNFSSQKLEFLRKAILELTADDLNEK